MVYHNPEQSRAVVLLPAVFSCIPPPIKKSKHETKTNVFFPQQVSCFFIEHITCLLPGFLCRLAERGKKNQKRKRRKKKAEDVKYFNISTDNTDYPLEWFHMQTLW
jgi:hypothetical protein